MLLASPLVVVLMALALLIIPLAWLAALVIGTDAGSEQEPRSAAEVAALLRQGFQTLGEDAAWEQFIENRIDDEQLDSLRAQAAALPVPMDASALATLRKLVAQADAMTGTP